MKGLSSIKINNYDKYDKLTSDKKREISEKAAEIIDVFNIDSFDFDVSDFITSKYHFSIKARLFRSPDITGAILVDDDNPVLDNNHKLIFINAKMIREEYGPQRIRFTILHEFGHYILHKQPHQSKLAMRDTNE